VALGTAYTFQLFKPNLGQMWTNPAVGDIIKLDTLLNERLGLSIFDPKLG